ncbi:hypothetical protein UlMin_014805 [Ulmus minor]
MNLVGVKIEPTASSLSGFTGDSISSEGILNLPVELGSSPCQHIQAVDFVLVDCPSPYNAIIGRPTLNKIRAVTSTYHLLVKFPIVGGIGILRGDQTESREIYEAANRSVQVQGIKSSSKSRDEIPITNIPNENGSANNSETTKAAGVHGKFLEFMVNHRGIEANPAKIQALLDMEPPRKIKEVQRLTGRIAALNRFISRATDRCKPFFQALRKGKDFIWTADCEQSFQELKSYLGKPPLLSKPHEGDSLILYLAVSKGAVSLALVREENGVQWPIYYTSKSLLDVETRYPEIEKLALALMQVFQKPEASGRLAKWSIELGEFDIQFKPRTAIKGQALADFIAEFTYTPEMSEKLTTQTQNSQWKLYVDGSSTETSSEAGIILVSPDGVKLSCAVRFKFKATNNQAEYEALLSGLRLAKEVSARHLTIYSDSQLVVSQVNSEFQAKGEKMASYLEKAKEAMNQFDTVTIIQVPRAENTNADALARLATGLEERLLKTVPIEILETPSIDKKEQVGSIVVRPCWIDPIISFLRDGTLPADKFEARRLRFRSARYFLDKGKLYKKGFSSPSLLCLDEDRGKFTLEEVHAGVCGNHSSGRTLAHRILRQGYYWPTIQTDSLDFVPIPRQAPEDLTTVTSPWPFAKWGIDLIGPLPTARGQFKYAVVAIDYYTKWVEAEALAKITEQNVTAFIWKNIVCRFGVPRELVSDHGTQFENEKLQSICDRLGIKKVFSSPAHPKSNGQVEAVNKTIKQTLKKKLEKSKGAGLMNSLSYYGPTEQVSELQPAKPPSH